MDKANIDYILNIFKTLTSELPEQMLYRDNGDNIQLRILDSIDNGQSSGFPENGWRLIGCKMIEAM